MANEPQSINRARWQAQTRDLSGFEDGSANPSLDTAAEVAIGADGASIALVQRWIHDLGKLHTLPLADQEACIGRTKLDSVEARVPGWETRAWNTSRAACFARCSYCRLGQSRAGDRHYRRFSPTTSTHGQVRYPSAFACSA